MIPWGKPEEKLPAAAGRKVRNDRAGQQPCGLMFVSEIKSTAVPRTMRGRRC